MLHALKQRRASFLRQVAPTQPGRPISAGGLENVSLSRLGHTPNGPHHTGLYRMTAIVDLVGPGSRASDLIDSIGTPGPGLFEFGIPPSKLPFSSTSLPFYSSRFTSSPSSLSYNGTLSTAHGIVVPLSPSLSLSLSLSLPPSLEVFEAVPCPPSCPPYRPGKCTPPRRAPSTTAAPPSRLRSQCT